MAKNWIPADVVREYVVKYGDTILEKKTEELWNISTFYLRKKLFGRGGITFHKGRIIFCEEDINILHPKQQASLIYHELVHVAQQYKMGWTWFMIKYSSEWIRAGFSYRKMLSFGLEQEAMDLEKAFRRKISGIWLRDA